MSSNFVFHRHFSVKFTFICTHTLTLAICLLFSLLPLSPLSICLPSSFHLLSLSCTIIFFFFQVSFPTFILPPWLNHRCFKTHTYVARHCTQTSVQTIFKPRLITSAPPGGRGKGKSRTYLGLQQLLKWNEEKHPVFISHAVLTKTHQRWETNVKSLVISSLPVESWIVSNSQNVFVLTTKARIDRQCCSANCKNFPLQATQIADTLFWWVAILVLLVAVVH